MNAVISIFNIPEFIAQADCFIQSCDLILTFASPCCIIQFK